MLARGACLRGNSSRLCCAAVSAIFADSLVVRCCFILMTKTGPRKTLVNGLSAMSTGLAAAS